MGFAVLKRQNDYHLLASYIPAQLIGAFLGAVLVWLQYLPHWKATEDGGSKLCLASPLVQLSKAPGQFFEASSLPLLFLLSASWPLAMPELPIPKKWYPFQVYTLPGGYAGVEHRFIVGRHYRLCASTLCVIFGPGAGSRNSAHSQQRKFRLGLWLDPRSGPPLREPSSAD